MSEIRPYRVGVTIAEQLPEDCALATTDTSPPDLAWDKQQRRFYPGPEAVGWRVYHQAQRGRGQRKRQIFTPNGPLHLEIDADFETLAAAVPGPGWYVLLAVDKNHMVIPGVPPAVVEVVAPIAPHPAREQTPSQTEGTLLALIQQLTTALTTQQEQAATERRELTQAVTQLAKEVFSGTRLLQAGTADLLTAATKGMDVASGVVLPRLPEPPALPAAAAPPKGFVDFLVSPAGKVAVEAFKGALEK